MRKLIPVAALVCAVTAHSFAANFKVIEYAIVDKEIYKIPVTFGATTTIAIHAKVIATPGKAFRLIGKTQDPQSGSGEERPAFEGNLSEVGGTTFITITPARKDAALFDTNLNVFLADGRSFMIIPQFSKDVAGIVQLGKTTPKILTKPDESIWGKEGAAESTPATYVGASSSVAAKPEEPEGKHATGPDNTSASMIGYTTEKPPSGGYKPDEPTIEACFRLLEMYDAYPTTKVDGISTTEIAKRVFDTSTSKVTQVRLVKYLNKDIFGLIGVIENKGTKPQTILPSDIAIRVGDAGESIPPVSFRPAVILPKTTAPLYAVFYKKGVHLEDLSTAKATLTVLPKERAELDDAGNPKPMSAREDATAAEIKKQAAK